VKSKYFKYFLGLIPLFFLGLLRENFMLNLNFVLLNKYHNQSENIDTVLFNFFSRFSYMNLYYTKWVIQVVFSIGFCLLTYLILSKWLKENFTLLQLALIYLVSAACIILVYFLGQINFFSGQTAHIARILLEIQHSPVIYMVLILITVFNQKIST
jgi:hypothetical protein